jgi:simple sugar transport system permease protein
VLFAFIYWLSIVPLKSNQIVAGTALNILSVGLTPFLCKILFESGGNTPALPLEARFQYEPTVFAILLVFLIWAFLKNTSLGLWLEVAGEYPAALQAAGIRVSWVQTFGILMSGVLGGMAGAALSIYLSSSFARNMTSGRGFMAIAAVIFGKWRPIPTGLACILFAVADAAQIRLQGVALWGEEPVPVQFVQMMPYLFTVIVLAGWVGRSRAPRSLGLPSQEA